MTGLTVESKESTPPSGSLIVTVLRAHDDGSVEEPKKKSTSPETFEAKLIRFEEREMILLAPSPVEINAALRIEAPETIWLGTVQSCYPADGNLSKRWEISVSISYMLDDFGALDRLAALFGAPPLKRNSFSREAIIQS